MAVEISLECFQPRTIRQPNVMVVLNSSTLPSLQLSESWWLLLHLKISQIRHVPICKLEFNLLPELTGVAAFMLRQWLRSGAWECRAGPLLSGQIYHFWMGGMYMHCKFAPACIETLSSQALLRFKHAFWLFSGGLFYSLKYKNLVDESGLDSIWHQKTPPNPVISASSCFTQYFSRHCFL